MILKAWVWITPKELTTQIEHEKSEIKTSEKKKNVGESVTAVLGSIQSLLFNLLSSTGVISTPCSVTSCPNNGRCDDSSGQVVCLCPLLKDCPRDNNPVCGSDRISYRNKCYMIALNCPKKKNVYVKRTGYCGTYPFYSAMSLVFNGNWSIDTKFGQS